MIDGTGEGTGQRARPLSLSKTGGQAETDWDHIGEHRGAAPAPCRNKYLRTLAVQAFAPKEEPVTEIRGDPQAETVRSGRL